MARILFTVALLLVVFTTAGAQNPMLKRQKRTFGFSLLGGRDWDDFRRWPFVSMTPAMKNMMNLFRAENSQETLIRRLVALERGHRQILENLQKMQDSKSKKQCPSNAENQPERVTLFSSSTAVPKIDVRVQPATPEVEDRTKSTTTPKTTSAELEDEEVPPNNKIALTKVEDKVESTPTATTAAEVDNKVRPATTPQKATSSEESREKVSTEEVETSEVIADAPATSKTAETVTDSIQETTIFEDSNDVNDIINELLKSTE